MKILLIAAFSLMASHGLSQSQGICGKVRWLEGNQMPGPGVRRSAGDPVQREIVVYELTTMNEIRPENGFYPDIPSKRVVATGKSNRAGKYRIKLPPGRYSVFVREKDGLWANRFDKDGVINPVTVAEGKFTVLDITVNYRAAY